MYRIRYKQSNTLLVLSCAEYSGNELYSEWHATIFEIPPLPIHPVDKIGDIRSLFKRPKGLSDSQFAVQVYEILSEMENITAAMFDPSKDVLV